MTKQTVKVQEMVIDGTTYVPKESAQTVVSHDGLDFVMIRTYSAGVHYGYLKEKKYTEAGTIVTLLDARRVYYWAGAATLSELAQRGTSKPESCKFPQAVSQIELTAIEIIPITDAAKETLDAVKVWSE